MGRLTTHVLDTAQGRPGKGIRIEVFRLEGEQRIRLKEVVTNDDGRCDAPILEGEGFAVGQYELVFHAGDYLDRKSTRLNSSHVRISYAVFCLKKKIKILYRTWRLVL